MYWFGMKLTPKEWKSKALWQIYLTYIVNEGRKLKDCWDVNSLEPLKEQTVLNVAVGILSAVLKQRLSKIL
jgi:hypothetical protein